MKKILLSTLLGTFALASAFDLAAEPLRIPSKTNTRINGVMIYDTDKDVSTYGVYSYTVTNPIARKQIYSLPRVSASGGAVVKGTMLYVYDYAVDYGYVSSARYYTYDLAAGTSTYKSVGYDTATAYANAAMSAAVDPTDETVWCCAYSYDATSSTISYNLATWDLENASKTVVASLSLPMRAMACAADGTLYGITSSTAATGSNNGGVLVKINKTTGELTTIGDTGVKPGLYYQSTVIDPATGTFYWFANEEDESSNLYSINPATAEATLLGSLPKGDQVVGAYIPEQTVADGAPSAATDIEAVFEGASLTGTIKFNVPQESFSGDPLTGDISYTVATADGVALATGQTSAGAAVAQQVTVPADGSYTFVVTLQNASGASEAAETSKYVGYDTPAVVTNLSLTREENVNTLSWTAPTQGVNGGYLDTENLKYKVVRHPDGVTVAEAQSETSFSESFDSEQLAAYYYTVTAVNGTKTSAEAASNSVTVGSAIVPPYQQPFDDASSLSLYNIIDANGDSNTWSYYSGTVRYRASYSKAADDWLVLPPLSLKAGNSYTLGYKVYGLSTRRTEKLEVKMGDAPTVDAMTATLKETASYSNTSATATTETITIKPEKDGIYYIGFHVTSEKSQGNLTLDNITVSEPVSTEIPQTAEIHAKPADKGVLSVNITFSAPKFTSGGKALELSDLTQWELSRDGKVIAKTTDFGETTTYEDTTISASGEYTYSVVYYNQAGAGEAAYAKVYVGIDSPVLSGSPTLADNNDGTASLKWNAVSETGKNGGYVDPAATVYTIADKTGVITTVTGLTSTILHGIDTENEQAEVSYTISAKNAIGDADDKLTSNTILSGAPYQLPYIESFANAEYTTSVWNKTTLAGKSYNATWNPRTDQDQNGDGGSADFGGYDTGATARLQSPKIALPTASAPRLSFYAMTTDTSAANIDVEITTDGCEWQTLGRIENATDWKQYTYDLSQYASSSVRIGFKAECVKTYQFVYIDHIVVQNITSGIDALTDGLKITADSDIRISGNTDGALVRVWNGLGQLVATTTDQSAVIRVARGVYIVSGGGRTQKVIVR